MQFIDFLMNHKIIFDKSNFDAILCLNGEISHFDYIKANKGKIYCADGAANQLINNNIIPDFIIGDLDSINQEELKSKHPTVSLFKVDSQESNDFEKCLDYLKEINATNILLFGMQGGELEHTLNNWSVLKKFAKSLNITILHNERYAFVVNENISINLDLGEVISIIPQTICKLKTKGLMWELNEEYLAIGSREGARNITTDKQIEIELIEGEYLLFINSRYPYFFNKKGS